MNSNNRLIALSAELLKTYRAFLRARWSRMLLRFRYGSALRCLKHRGKNLRIEQHVQFSDAQNILLGNDILICQGVILRPRRNQIFIDDGSSINPYVCIFGKVRIGKYATIAPNVMVFGGNHAIDGIDVPMIQKGRSDIRGIEIGDDVWLGASSVILDGVSIGKGAVVGAGSVVTKDVQGYDIVAGNPARRIGSRLDLKSGDR